MLHILYNQKPTIIVKLLSLTLLNYILMVAILKFKKK